MSDQPTYRIRPLEWRCVRDDGVEGAWWSASTIFGSMDVEKEPDGPAFWRYCFDEYYDEGRHTCGSVEAGRADAEAFYLARLLLALAIVEGGAA